MYVCMYVCLCNLTLYLTSLSLSLSLSLDSLSLQTAQGSVVLKGVDSLRQDWAAAADLHSYRQ